MTKFDLSILINDDFAFFRISHDWVLNDTVVAGRDGYHLGWTNNNLRENTFNIYKSGFRDL